MKFATKQDYLDATAKAWSDVWNLVDGLTESQLTKRVSLKNGPARSAKDALAHVYSWHVLLLKWYRDGLERTPDLPAKGYKWSQTRDLNAVLHDEHEGVELASIKRKLKLSHGRVAKLVTGLSEKQLLLPAQFEWTGKLSLMSYVAPNTVSHYRWATKKIKALLRAMDANRSLG